jgi:hypothetical protein
MIYMIIKFILLKKTTTRRFNNNNNNNIVDKISNIQSNIKRENLKTILEQDKRQIPVVLQSLLSDVLTGKMSMEQYNDIKNGVVTSFSMLSQVTMVLVCCLAIVVPPCRGSPHELLPGRT